MIIAVLFAFLVQENNAPCRFGFVFSVPTEKNQAVPAVAGWPEELPQKGFEDFIVTKNASPASEQTEAGESTQALVVLAFSYFEEEYERAVSVFIFMNLGVFRN